MRPERHMVASRRRDGALPPRPCREHPDAPRRTIKFFRRTEPERIGHFSSRPRRRRYGRFHGLLPLVIITEQSRSVVRLEPDRKHPCEACSPPPVVVKLTRNLVAVYRVPAELLPSTRRTTPEYLQNYSRVPAQLHLHAGRATDGADGHRRRSVRAMWRGSHRCDIRSTDERRRPPGTPREGARTTYRDTLCRSRARRSMQWVRAPHLGSHNGAITRSHRQVAVDGGAAQCTAAGAPVDRGPNLFPHRRRTAARRLCGFVQPRLIRWRTDQRSTPRTTTSSRNSTTGPRRRSDRWSSLGGATA
jgi:hypothetical protein